MNGFLFDKNTPRKLLFTPSLPVIHSTDLGSSVSDSTIWFYAHSNRMVIVTKDADFSNRVMVSSPPPWVVHLRIGNMRKHEFQELLRRVWTQIESLLPTHKLINVYLEKIEAIQG